MIAPARRAPLAIAVSALALILALPSLAEWLEPDPSYREAQIQLRIAQRDTAGHADDPGLLDSLGVALLALAREVEAERAFARAIERAPGDRTAAAGLGKLALFHDRLAEAESLLAIAGPEPPGALADRFAGRARAGDWAGAAAMAQEADQAGCVPLYERLATGGAYAMSGSDEATQIFTRVWPVPLVRVKLNGQSVLFAIDTGASDLLIDRSAARRCKVQSVSGQRLVFWSGSRVAVQNALVQRLEIAGLKIASIPAATLALRRYSIEIHPQSEQVAGVIGLNLLRRFTPTIDYARGRLELRRLGAAAAVAPGAARVPFEIWGESELTVFGTLAAGRRMALVVQTGMPGCGIGAPKEVFEEIGVKPGSVTRVMTGAGSFLKGRPWVACSVPGVSVGPLVSDHVTGLSGALDSSELWRHGVRRDAVLAGEFFKGRRVTIDWKKMELLVEEGD